MHDNAYIGGCSENNIKCVVHDDLGWKNQTTQCILPRHWLYEWFPQFHSGGTYLVFHGGLQFMCYCCMPNKDYLLVTYSQLHVNTPASQSIILTDVTRPRFPDGLSLVKVSSRRRDIDNDIKHIVSTVWNTHTAAAVTSSSFFCLISLFSTQLGFHRSGKSPMKLLHITVYRLDSLHSMKPRVSYASVKALDK